MDIILQFYGLSFLVPGLLILVWPKHESEYPIAKFIWLLGVFGVAHGLVEWIDLWHKTYGQTLFLDIAGPFLLLISYLAVFEFGRRLIRASLLPDAPAMWLWLCSPWIYVAPVAATLCSAYVSAQPPTLLLRYFTGLTGPLLTGTGFLLYWRRHIKSQVIERDYVRIRYTIVLLAVSFILYGLLSGLTVPWGEWFPISPSSADTFYINMQMARGISVGVIAITLIYFLRIFDLETRRQLEVARATSAQDKQSLERTSLQYDLLLQAASDGIHVLDVEGNVVEAGDSFCRMLGYSREEILRMNVIQWDAHFSPDELKQRIPMLMGKLATFETRHRRRDGKIIDVEISTVGVNIDGRTLLYCTSHDISDRKHADDQLRLVARVFDRAAEGVVITDADQRILTVNDSFTTVTGYTREEVIGKRPSILQSGKQGPDFYKVMWESLHANGWWQGEIWNRRKNGELYLEWLSINTVRDEHGKIINYIGMFSDITLIKESRQRMEYLATHDELTDLPNRTLFNDHLRLALARSARAGTHLALLFVDLDNFKLINDTLGHQEGDALLKQVAARLKACVRQSDTVARLGGDEFVVLLEIEQRSEAALMATRILDAFAASFTLQDQECFITSSIGISLFPEDAPDPQILMRHADTAMYRAKEHGKNTYMFFTADMAQHISRRMIVENSLRHAIGHDELFLEYQPQIDLRNHRLVGVEALLRWRQQEDIIFPAAFIQIAEESGLVVDIDEWVMSEVCRQVRLWDESGLPSFWVSINTSARHFRRADIYSRLTGIAAAAEVSPERLCLEITEGVLMDVESADRVLRNLHDAGFRVSVDDFGTGFSSLSYLKRLPIHEVKVDRSFVDGIASDPDDRAITTAIIAMARGLGLRTVAEGVETEVQQAELRRMGCDIGQGFLYSHPLSATALQAWILERGQQP